MEVQEGLASPFQEKLGFTQMLRVFRVDSSNAYISISIFARHPKYGHILVYVVTVLTLQSLYASSWALVSMLLIRPELSYSSIALAQKHERLFSICFEW